MPQIIQIPFEVPDDVAIKLISGELKRMGSIAVRDSQGIVLHLKEAVAPAGRKSDFAAIAAVVQSNKLPILIGIGGLLAVGGATWWASTRTKRAQNAVPAWLVEYNDALAAYIEAIQSSSLKLSVIDRLINAIDAVQSCVDDDSVNLEIAPEQLLTLVRLISDYSSKFAAANPGGPLSTGDDAGTEGDSNGATALLLRLRGELEFQKQVVERAA